MCHCRVTCIESWDDIVPHPDHFVFVQSIQAFICVGEFVLVHPSVEEQELLEVGRVIDVKKYMEDGEGSQSHEEHEVLVNWYLFDLDLPPIGENERNIHVKRHSLKEVVQTAAVEWVAPHQIADIAFVFHLSSITEEGTYHHCFGINNAFFLRSCRLTTAIVPWIVGGELLEIGMAAFDSLVSGDRDTFSECTWSLINGINVAVHKIVGHWAENQQLSVCLTLNFISQEFWFYMRQ